MSASIKDQLRDKILIDAYKLALLNNVDDILTDYDTMTMHYEATIGRCRLHVSINIKDVRRDDHE